MFLCKLLIFYKLLLRLRRFWGVGWGVCLGGLKENTGVLFFLNLPAVLLSLSDCLFFLRTVGVVKDIRILFLQKNENAFQSCSVWKAARTKWDEETLPFFLISGSCRAKRLYISCSQCYAPFPVNRLTAAGRSGNLIQEIIPHKLWSQILHDCPLWPSVL